MMVPRLSFYNISKYLRIMSQAHGANIIFSAGKDIVVSCQCPVCSDQPHALPLIFKCLNVNPWNKW